MTRDERLDLKPRGDEREARFVAAATASEQFPDLGGQPEVALAGRSNVGKSSFLNALTGGKRIARISRTPGRTRSVNFYYVQNHFRVRSAVIVDLPGYGFARVSREERNSWKIVVESYLQRSELKLVVLIVDGRTGPTKSDLEMAGWLQHKSLRMLVLVTKLDKLSKNAAKRAVKEAAEVLTVDPETVFPFSSVKREGVKEMWRALADHLAAAGATTNVRKEFQSRPQESSKERRRPSSSSRS